MHVLSSACRLNVTSCTDNPRSSTTSSMAVPVCLLYRAFWNVYFVCTERERGEGGGQQSPICPPSIGYTMNDDCSLPPTVHYMGAGIKSHQDTVVHPMYVSYNSLPTTGGSLLRHSRPPSSATLARAKRSARAGIPVHLTATLNRPPGLVECHKNFVSFNGSDNLLSSSHHPTTTVVAADLKSCNVPGKTSLIMATTDEFPNYFPPTPIAANSTDPRNGRRPYLQDGVAQRKLDQRKSMVEGDVSFYAGGEPVDDLIDLQPANARLGSRRAHDDIEGEHLPEYNSFNRANILVNQRLKNGSFYKMPADFIPRSPNFSSSGHRRRNQNVTKNMNFCDQIRRPVVGAQQQRLPDSSIGHGPSQGTKQLPPRPRSYCSSSYYHEFEQLPATTTHNFVNAPN